MVYCLNEKYPYYYQDAIVCYYSFPDSCILQGVVRWDKKLVISNEKCFTNASKNDVASFLKKIAYYPWINKNPYFSECIKDSYYQLDFDDESDLAMLADGMEELKYNNRILYIAEKTETKNRDKCLQMLVKALNYYLNKDYIDINFSAKRNEFFPHPVSICYSECGEDSISDDVGDNKVKLPERKVNRLTRRSFESRLNDFGYQYIDSKSGLIEKIKRIYR